MQFHFIRLFRILACALFLATPAGSMAATNSYPEPVTLHGPYPAEVLRVIDGDSIKVRVHIWLDQEIITTVRLQGLDTAELKSRCAAEAEQALAAKDYLEKLTASGVIEIYDIRRDKFGGRVLAKIRTEHKADVAQAMIDAKMGRSYSGGKRLTWCSA